MAKEESDGKFPPLLMNSGMRIKKRERGKEKKMRGEENRIEKEKRKKRGREEKQRFFGVLTVEAQQSEN